MILTKLKTDLRHTKQTSAQLRYPLKPQWRSSHDQEQAMHQMGKIQPQLQSPVITVTTGEKRDTVPPDVTHPVEDWPGKHTG